MKTKTIAIALLPIIALLLPSCQKQPTACFSCEEIGQACPQGHTYKFTNCSTEAATYTWDFGDGETSALATPEHCYSSGSYTIKLTAVSENGHKKDNTSQTISIP